MVWEAVKYLDNGAIFWEIFDQKLLFQMGFNKQSLFKVQMVFEWLSLSWIKSKVVRACVHFRRKWVMPPSYKLVDSIGRDQTYTLGGI